MIFDRLNGHRAALGLSDHGEETLFKHHARELVHARGGGRASGADDFLAHRIDRTDLINNATFKLDWEGLALCQHISAPLMRRIAARQHFAVVHQAVAMFAALHPFRSAANTSDLPSLMRTSYP